MKKNYYLIGSCIGLVTALVMLITILGTSGLETISISEKYNGLIPSLVGALTVLGLGYFFDRKSVPTVFINQVFLIPVFILICGSITGGLANYFLNGYPHFFFDYFTRPIWALGLFGFPATIVVALAWKFIFRQLSESRWFFAFADKHLNLKLCKPLG